MNKEGLVGVLGGRDGARQLRWWSWGSGGCQKGGRAVLLSAVAESEARGFMCGFMEKDE